MQKAWNKAMGTYKRLILDKGTHLKPFLPSLVPRPSYPSVCLLALVVQVMNTGVGRPGYEATSWSLTNSGTTLWIANMMSLNDPMMSSPYSVGEQEEPYGQDVV